MNAATPIHDFLLATAQPPRLRSFAVQWRADDDEQSPRVLRVLAADEHEARDMLAHTLGRTDFVLRATS